MEAEDWVEASAGTSLITHQLRFSLRVSTPTAPGRPPGSTLTRTVVRMEILGRNAALTGDPGEHTHPWSAQYDADTVAPLYPDPEDLVYEEVLGRERQR